MKLLDPARFVIHQGQFIHHRRLEFQLLGQVQIVAAKNFVEDFIYFSESELAKVHQLSIKKARDFLKKAQTILDLNQL